MGKGEIAHNEQFLLFPECFLLNQVIVFPFVHIFDIISIFAAELEEPKIGLSGKSLKTENILLATFDLSAANAFNLNRAKFLSFGKELNTIQLINISYLLFFQQITDDVEHRMSVFRHHFLHHPGTRGFVSEWPETIELNKKIPWAVMSKETWKWTKEKVVCLLSESVMCLSHLGTVLKSFAVY